MNEDLKKELRNKLSKEDYKIIVEKGTEAPGTGKYNLNYEKGKYTCKVCNSVLFNSDNKFDSGCGWPSFDKEIAKDSIKEIRDVSFGMIRTEITCSNCDAHLGHVFNDGPTETGLRYCVNSASIEFDQDTEDAERSTEKK